MADTYIDVVLPTFRLEPDENEKFYPSVAKKIADSILIEELSGRVYEEDEVNNISLSISDRVREAVTEKLNNTRYKVVVQTTVGQMKDQGIRIASRCLWDPVTDNYVSTSFKNVRYIYIYNHVLLLASIYQCLY